MYFEASLEDGRLLKSNYQTPRTGNGSATLCKYVLQWCSSAIHFVPPAALMRAA
jgi:hypothetical protein